MTGAGEAEEEGVRGVLALQRALALDGRNALARVELAASELQRLGLSPAGLDRVDSIRGAVGELDALLDQIERIAERTRRRESSSVARLGPIVEAVLARVAPVLAARGIALACAEPMVERAVALSPAVVERLLLTALRTSLSAAGWNEREHGAPGARVEITSREEGEAIAVELAIHSAPRSERATLEHAAQVELDVALAEWGGGSRFDATDACLTCWLPAEVLDDGVA